jgi:hypothetical protein
MIIEYFIFLPNYDNNYSQKMDQFKKRELYLDSTLFLYLLIIEEI